MSALKYHQVTIFFFAKSFIFLNVIFCIKNSFSAKTLSSMGKTTYSSVFVLQYLSLPDV